MQNALRAELPGKTYSTPLAVPVLYQVCIRLIQKNTPRRRRIRLIWRLRPPRERIRPYQAHTNKGAAEGEPGSHPAPGPEPLSVKVCVSLLNALGAPIYKTVKLA